MRLNRNVLSGGSLLALCLAVVTACGAGSVDVAMHSAAATVAAAASGCPADPLAGVHDPQRLKVMTPCATFMGTVSRAPKLNASDGDVTFNAKPDPGYESMLNSKNLSEGGLHIEIVPRDQTGCTPGQPVKGTVGNLGTCSGANVAFPPLGAQVRVTGTWVMDMWVGWNEIHPVASVEIIPATGPQAPERHVFAAHLVGRSRPGAPPRTARATVTITNLDLCWAFSRLTRIGTPLRAMIQASPANGGPTMPAITLGSRYSARGCMKVTDALVQPLLTTPRRFQVILYTRRYKRGAARGQLTPASD
jgi:hypothetical protein